MKSIYYLLLMLVALSSCMESNMEVLSEEDIEPRIVLNAMWESADTTHTLDVRRTGLVKTTTIENYTSSLTVNGVGIEPNERGAYIFRPQPGDEVNVAVQVGKERVSASARVPQPVIIEGVDTLHIIKSTDKVFQRSDEHVRFLLHLRLPEGAEGTQFFRLSYSTLIRTVWNATVKDGHYTDISYDHFWMHDYNYDSDVALCENRNQMAEHSDEFAVDIVRSVPNLYSLFSSRCFIDGRYTLTIDVPFREPYSKDSYVYVRDTRDTYKCDLGYDLKHIFRVLTIPQIEYNYLWSVAALTEMYDPSDLTSNPPIVPSNIEGGTGIFSISAAAEYSLEENHGLEVKVGDEFH